MKTQFQVALFHTIDGTEPFTTIETEAKMPLSAMVFALNCLRVKSAGRVDVTWGEEVQEFYNVKINGEHITYDRAVVVQEEEPASVDAEETDRTEAETAYRRGFVHGMEEIGRLIAQLMELEYKTTEIKRLLAVYDDHFITPWRNDGDLTKRKAPPPFDINACQEILEGTTGYDWIT